VTQRGLTFVTLVFESEVSLLELQAASMAVHLDRHTIHEIVVIDNSARGLPAATQRRLRAAYEHLGPSVRVLPAAQVARVPASVGWRRQQVIKLEVARLLSPGLYVVLDAKNHFIAPPASDFFVAADGRPCVNAYSYETHTLRGELEQSLTYMGLDPSKYVSFYTATVTPFVLDTSVVIDLMDGVAARGGGTFAEEFLRQNFTEFLLYSAWLLATGHALDDYYNIHQVFCPTVWPRGASTQSVRSAIREARDGEAPLLSVHRRALAGLDAVAVTVLVEFWVSRGLFADVRAGQALVERFRREFIRGERRRKLRELPVKTRQAASARMSRA
jgi:hypothetical protein